MSEIGLTAHVHEDVSAYEAPWSVAGIRMPKRMVKSFGAAIALAAAVGIYIGFGLNMDASMFMPVYIIIAIGGFLFGFYEHNGLKPEVWLPHKLRNSFQGKYLIRESRSITSGAHARLNEGVKRDKAYRKAIKKKGARRAEIYLPRIEEASERMQARICQAQEGGCQES